MTGSEADGLSISEVAARSGVPATTLRYYETVGLLPDPPRIAGRRRYDSSVLDRLVVIGAARQARFSIAEVRELLDGMSTGAGAGPAWRAMASRKLPEVDDLIRALDGVRTLLQAVATCECDDLSQCAAQLRHPPVRP